MLAAHLCLSRTPSVWGSGQDQCATIKRQLERLMPGVIIFLDVSRTESNLSRSRQCESGDQICASLLMRQVDNLQSIDELEKYIHESAASYRHWNHGAIHLPSVDRLIPRSLCVMPGGHDFRLRGLLQEQELPSRGAMRGGKGQANYASARLRHL